jgi:hypothetical protein
MPLGISWEQLGWAATGFFFMTTLAMIWSVHSLKKQFPRERRWYETVVDSKLHIEREA